MAAAILTVLTLLATGAGQGRAIPPGGASDPADPFRPDTVVTAPGGPRIVLLESAATGVAALRLFVPLEEAPVEAGTGEVLRALALERMEGLARPVGARVSASRTPYGLAYLVEGALADFEYLAYLLREAVAAPPTDRVAMNRALRGVREALDRARESPPDFLVARLRRLIAPGVPPPFGTAATIDGIDAARVLEVWRRTHDGDAMTLVVSAALTPEVILAATRLR